MVVPTIVPYLNKEVWEKYIPEQVKQKDEEQENTEEAIPSEISESYKLKT